MKKSLIIIKEKVIRATSSEIWKIITTPDYFEEWMFVPGRVAHTLPFGLGSKIEWINNNQIVYLAGEVIAFVPNQKIDL